MDEIDYNTKISNFLAMTETGDQEIAMKYLEETNWDETKAVNNFFNKGKINSTPMTNNNLTEKSNDFDNTITSANRLDKTLISLDNNIINELENNKRNKNKKKSLIARCFMKPLKFLLNCCIEQREINKSEEKKIFQFLPNITDDFINFCQSIKRKIGIIIFYTGNNVPFLNNFISLICRSSISINILKQYFIIYPLLANTNEGYRIQDIISQNQLLFPSFVFCYNSSNNNKNEIYTNSILNKSNIIRILESESITLNVFHNTLIETSKKLNIHKKNNINDEIDKSFGPLTDAEILNQQNYDMEELEREAKKKEDELEKEKINEEKRKKEEEMKMKEIEDKAKEAKAKIVEEPNEDDPNCSIICFRYPDGQKTKNRRFLKEHTIQNLYDYITSLGEEIYTEKENNNFSLYQPFPPKKYDQMDNTLEKEGLFPNAVIQIREESE